MKLLAFLLFFSVPGLPQSLSFAFIGVGTDHQPDLAQRLQSTLIEKLGNVKKLDIISEKELLIFRTNGILPKGIPQEDQLPAINEILGPTVFFSIYLNKISHTASNNFWPPLSADISYSGDLELVLMESKKGNVLFSGSIKSRVSTTKWFSSVKSPEDKLFVDAVDRDNLMNSLIVKLSDASIKRVKQVLLEFSFQDKKQQIED